LVPTRYKTASSTSNKTLWLRIKVIGRSIRSLRPETAVGTIVSAHSKLQLSFILLQPFRQPGDAFVQINLGRQAQFFLGSVNVQRVTVAVGSHFGCVGMLANLEFEIRQRFSNCPDEIFVNIGLVETNVVGAAKRLI